MRKYLAPARWIALALLLVIGATVVLVLPAHEDSASAATVPPLVWIEEGGLRYEFHLPTGSESLFDVGGDPAHMANLIDERPQDAERLRKHLSKRHGVGDIEDLRVHYKETTEALRSLGYL